MPAMTPEPGPTIAESASCPGNWCMLLDGHPHRKVRTFDIGRADVIRFGIAGHLLLDRALADRRAVAPLGVASGGLSCPKEARPFAKPEWPLGRASGVRLRRM